MRLRHLLPIPVLVFASLAHYRNLRKVSSSKVDPPSIPGHRGVLEVNGLSVGYRMSDRGGPRFVVLIHGWGSSSDATWLNFIKDTDFSFVALDLPGYGDSSSLSDTSIESTAHLMNMALRLLSVRDPLLVAHSYGGLVAREMSRREPDFFRKLVMVSSASTFRRFPLQIYAKLAPYVLGRKSPIGLYNTARSLRRADQDERVLTAWRWSQSPDSRTMTRTARSALKKTDGATTDGGVLWVVPERDIYIHPRLQMSSAGLNDSVISVPDASHGFIERDPAALIDIIKTEMAL